jgi:hypothetical protein
LMNLSTELHGLLGDAGTEQGTSRRLEVSPQFE